jgi:hypothetical protein
MAHIDVPAIRAKKQEIADRRQAGVAWCVVALGELHDAFVAVDTPVRGGPDFLQRTYGAETGSGVWPVLRDEKDDWLMSLFFGVSMTASGSLYLGNKPTTGDEAAGWIAARCDYQPEIMGRVFEAALLGESWNARTALNQW